MDETITYHLKVVDNLTPALENAHAALTQQAEGHQAVTAALQAETSARRAHLAAMAETKGLRTEEQITVENLSKANIGYAGAAKGAAAAVREVQLIHVDYVEWLKRAAAATGSALLAMTAYLDKTVFLDGAIKNWGKLKDAIVLGARAGRRGVEILVGGLLTLTAGAAHVTRGIDILAAKLGLARRQLTGFDDVIEPMGPATRLLARGMASVSNALGAVGRGAVTAAKSIGTFLARHAGMSAIVTGAVALAREYVVLYKHGIELNRQSAYTEAVLTAIAGSAHRAAEGMAAVSEAARAGVPFARPELEQTVKVLERFEIGSLASAEGLRVIGNAAIIADESISTVAEGLGEVVQALRLTADGSDESRRLLVETLQPLAKMGVISQEAATQLAELAGETYAVERGLGILSDELHSHADATELVADTYIGLKERVTASYDELASRLTLRNEGLGKSFERLKLHILDWAHSLLDIPGDWLGHLSKGVGLFANMQVQIAGARGEMQRMAEAVASPDWEGQTAAAGAQAVQIGNLSRVYQQLDEELREIEGAERAAAQAARQAAAENERAAEAAARAAEQRAQTIADLEATIQGLPTRQMAADFELLREAWNNLPVEAQNASLMSYGEALSRAADEGHKLVGEEVILAGVFRDAEEAATRSAEALVINARATAENARAAEYAAMMQERHTEKINDLAAELQGLPTSRMVQDMDNLREAWARMDAAGQARAMLNYGEALVDAAEAGHELTAAELGIAQAFLDSEEAAEEGGKKAGETAATQLAIGFRNQVRREDFDATDHIAEQMMLEGVDPVTAALSWVMMKALEKVNWKAVGDALLTGFSKAWDFFKAAGSAIWGGIKAIGKGIGKIFGFQHGTQIGDQLGYGQFGAGMPAVLHGQEAVVPRTSVPMLASDIASMLIGPLRMQLAPAMAGGFRGGFEPQYQDNRPIVVKSVIHNTIELNGREVARNTVETSPREARRLGF